MKIKYPEVGKRLVELRKNKNLKQKDCLIPLGEPTLQMLCSWEKGYSFPSFNYLRNIANFYNVSLDYLILGVNKDGPRGELTKYSEILNVLVQLLESNIFELDTSQSNSGSFKCTSLFTWDALVNNFCLKLVRLKDSKDLYGETKYQQALDELINSFPNEIEKQH